MLFAHTITFKHNHAQKLHVCDRDQKIINIIFRKIGSAGNFIILISNNVIYENY